MSSLLARSGSTPEAPAQIPAAGAALPAIAAVAVAILVCSEVFAASLALLWPVSELLGGGVWLHDGCFAVAVVVAAAAGLWLFHRAWRAERRLTAGLEPDV